MALESGTRLGAYDVLRPIGQGGMGEVYRARDRRLDRDVALKILPDSFALDADRLMRFEREAKTLAALNHAHIAQIYSVEELPRTDAHASSARRVLVMELIEGEDLSERIARGAIPLDEAVPIARQIAEALEAAHDMGIVHRDLKPANIKLRADGSVKVLDFGLAKYQLAGPGAPDAAGGATLTSPAMTMQGVILGTAAYMAPEQAKGKPVDRRADIWAFGCVLYEMLTGMRAFPGEDVTDTIAAVVTRDPDWSLLPVTTPVAVRTLLRRCLEKNAQKRLPHIGVARLDLDGTAATPLLPSADRAPSSRWPIAAAASVLAAIAVVAGAAAALWYTGSARETSAAPAYRTALLIPAAQGALMVAPTSRFAISPDGSRLAYVGWTPRAQQLWLRSLDTFEARPIADVEGSGAGSVFWSPDSRHVAFFANGELRRVDTRGGAPTRVAEAPFFRQQPHPGTWNGDDIILVGGPRGLMRVAASGGALTPLTTLDESAGEQSHVFPLFLPDGRHFLYTAYRGLSPAAVYVSSLDAPEQRRKVMDGGSNVQYAAGALLFMRGNTLVAQPFDTGTLTLSGEPAPVAENLLPNIAVHFGGAFSTSGNGALVYQAVSGALGTSAPNDRLVWRTRTGQEQALHDIPSAYRHVDIAPDGRRAVVNQLNNDGRGDLWTIDLARGVPTRVTFTGNANAAVWLTNDELILNSTQDGSLSLYRKRSDGRAAEGPVLVDERPKVPSSASRDGKWLLFDRASPETGADIWVMALDGSTPPAPFVASPFQDRWAQFSPDGRWVAYMADESGRREIYVRGFPRGDGALRISPNGGDYPRWSRDGKELYFYSNGKLMAAAIRTDAAQFSVDSITALFDYRPPVGFSRMFYDVAPDGRFLMMTSSDNAGMTGLVLTVNWPALLESAER